MIRLTIENAFKDPKSFYKAFYGFLKKYGLFHKLYTNRAMYNIPNFKSQKKAKDDWIPDFWICWCQYILYDATDDFRDTNDERHKRKLILSQFWRFYLLDIIDSLDLVDKSAKEQLIKELRYSIEINGTREDEELKKYFKKYKINYYD